MIDGLPLPQTLGQMLFAMLIALLTGGGLVKFIQAYQERGKPAADIHLSGAQAEKTLAEALETKARADGDLMRVAIALATAAHEETKVLREELKESKQHTADCEARLSALEQQSREK